MFKKIFLFSLTSAIIINCYAMQMPQSGQSIPPKQKKEFSETYFAKKMLARQKKAKVAKQKKAYQERRNNIIVGTSLRGLMLLAGIQATAAQMNEVDTFESEPDFSNKPNIDVNEKGEIFSTEVYRITPTIDAPLVCVSNTTTSNKIFDSNSWDNQMQCSLPKPSDPYLCGGDYNAKIITPSKTQSSIACMLQKEKSTTSKEVWVTSEKVSTRSKFHRKHTSYIQYFAPYSETATLIPSVLNNLWLEEGEDHQLEDYLFKVSFEERSSLREARWFLRKKICNYLKNHYGETLESDWSNLLYKNEKNCYVPIKSDNDLQQALENNSACNPLVMEQFFIKID